MVPLILFPCINPRAGFFCLRRRKGRDVADMRPSGLCPFQGFNFLFMFLAVGRAENWKDLGISDCHFYFLCVLGSTLIDGLIAYTHCNFTKASVHSWLWWCGSNVSQNRWAVSALGDEGTAQRTDTSPGGTITTLAVQDRPDILGGRNGACEEGY
jgi:hypothetical protein